MRNIIWMVLVLLVVSTLPALAWNGSRGYTSSMPQVTQTIDADQPKVTWTINAWKSGAPTRTYQGQQQIFIKRIDIGFRGRIIWKCAFTDGMNTFCSNQTIYAHGYIKGANMGPNSSWPDFDTGIQTYGPNGSGMWMSPNIVVHVGQNPDDRPTGYCAIFLNFFELDISGVMIYW